MGRRFSPFNLVSVALGMAFLYLPIVILVIYSFNDSRLVTVWGGWSLRWYAALLEDSALQEATANSLLIAFSSASAATVLGTLAALALTRLGRFRGRLPFVAMVYAPLVMPEVITGLSLLLFFVAINLDRGFLTITFLTVTAPAIAPAIAVGFLLAFSLSLDDLVIASFTTGPGATTLPIRIYSEVRLGVKPEINAVCTIFVTVIALVVIAASILTRRAERRQHASAS